MPIEPTRARAFEDPGSGFPNASSPTKAAPESGLRPWGARVVLADSITEAAGDPGGAVIVSGSHAGASVVRYVLQAMPRLVVFNDAGIGRDEAGVVALAVLQDHGIAACAVSHASARIGDA